MNEQTIEQALKHAVEADGGLCWKLVSPGTTGVPDHVCLRSGRVVFVEVKAAGKQPRPIQQHRLRQLHAQGFTALVIDSVDQIGEVTDALSAA